MKPWTVWVSQPILAMSSALVATFFVPGCGAGTIARARVILGAEQALQPCKRAGAVGERHCVEADELAAAKTWGVA